MNRCKFVWIGAIALVATLRPGYGLADRCQTPRPKAEGLAPLAVPERVKIEIQLAPNPPVRESPAGESYGEWQLLEARGLQCRVYSFEANGQIQRHYVIWFASDPLHCYCFNRDTRLYWGRWNYTLQGITFTRAETKVALLSEGRFVEKDVIPTAPGTHALMTPPKPPAVLPDDLPPDVQSLLRAL